MATNLIFFNIEDMHEKLLQLERRITDKMFELQMIILRETQTVRKYDDEAELKPSIYGLMYKSLDETSDVNFNMHENFYKKINEEELETNINVNVKSEKIHDLEVFRFNVTVLGTSYENCFNYTRKINRSQGIVEELHENKFRVSSFNLIFLFNVFYLFTIFFSFFDGIF